MCTVTIVPRLDGLRMACNRDEAIARPAARPPRIASFGDRRAIFPLDPRGGGTWIAASDAGLVMALLNVNARRKAGRAESVRRGRAAAGNKVALRPAGMGTVSRGGIIPALLHCGSLDEAVIAARRIETDRYLPFRLVIVDHRMIADLRVVDGRLRARRRPLGHRPLMFTSSGLDDRLVDPPRRALFHRLVAVGSPERMLRGQSAFHRHRWPDRPHLSVDMRRPGARTVCHASIDLSARGIRFVFRPGGPRGRPHLRNLR